MPNQATRLALMSADDPNETYMEPAHLLHLQREPKEKLDFFVLEIVAKKSF
ncbi:hypothetical protein [Helicobacter labacensis]|uniref:hypothetical protein n=1 Tax=Helicobacter labacensis TaxID=2316079 RepID=UPI0013CDF327|nr:hypothetical protein [Helicobacter labacensis]